MRSGIGQMVRTVNLESGQVRGVGVWSAVLLVWAYGGCTSVPFSCWCSLGTSDRADLDAARVNIVRSEKAEWTRLDVGMIGGLEAEARRYGYVVDEWVKEEHARATRRL